MTTVMTIVTTHNNGIGNTDYLHSMVSGQTFIVNTTHDIPQEPNIDLPILKPKKLTTEQLEIYVLSIGYMFNPNGEKIQVTSFKDLPEGVYYIRIGGILYQYNK